MINNFIWRLCEQCTVRNCNKQPVPLKHGYTCEKRRAFQKGFKLLDIAMEHEVIDLMKIVFDHGLQIKENGAGYTISRRPLKENEYAT